MPSRSILLAAALCGALGACTLLHPNQAQRATEPTPSPVRMPAGNPLNLPVLPRLGPAAGAAANGEIVTSPLPPLSGPHPSAPLSLVPPPTHATRPSPPLRASTSTPQGVRLATAADTAMRRVPAQLPPLSAPDHELASAALADLMQRINLSDDQIRRRNRVAALLKAGKTAAAAELGLQLDREVRSADRRYTVRPSDKLGTIAQRAFGNTELWPLIWHANQQQIKNPTILPRGAILTIPLHPTSQEAADAIAEAHAASGKR